MIDLSKIKLIIWDLDDTLWTGTLSEGGCVIPTQHHQLIRDLVDAGIVNSICSKNEFDYTKQELERIGLWEYFVFASINWDNKGKRIQRLIDQMALRPVNVLFIDDNVSNLQEAQFYLPDIHIATPDIIPTLIEQLQKLPKKDISHSRLKQYQVLEEKAIAAEAFDSNEDFLYSSNIRVELHVDCMSIADRIHELLLRTNQLNFTKKRISLDELTTILQDPSFDCGYVSVKDNFGDYGIVGFYAIKDNRLEHFLFSCRTMGQMIEQYVYAQLGFPELEVVGEVRTLLNAKDCPAWINQDVVSNVQIENDKLSCKLLLKGPCDLSNAQSYIHNDDTTTEFTYVLGSTGQEIDTYNHSVHIRGLFENTPDENRQIAEDCPFVDPNMLSGTFYTGQYDVIFLSSLIESVYHIYKKKNSSIQVVYRASVDKEREKRFFEQYECVGLTTPEQYRQFLVESLDRLSPKTTLCVILGSTLLLPGSESLAERHRAINNEVMKLAMINPRLRYIDVDEFVRTPKDVTDSINHYQTRVYYDIAQAMIAIIKDVTGVRVVSASKSFVVLQRIIKFIRRVVKKRVSPNSCLYKFLQRMYFKITRRKSNVK